MGLFKRWGTPSTPKLASVSLPDDTLPAPAPAPAPAHTHQMTAPRLSDKISPIAHTPKHAPSRSSSPLQSFFRPRRESLSGGGKTVPRAYDVTCAVTLPSKPDIPMSQRTASTSTGSSGGKSSTLESPPALSATTSSMSWREGRPSNAKPILKATSKPRPSHPGDPSVDAQPFAFPGSGKPVSYQYAAHAEPPKAHEHHPHRLHVPAKQAGDDDVSSTHPRRRHHSTTGHAYTHPTPLPPKRVDTPMTATYTTVHKVPTKAEAISLAWPLLEHSPQRRRPLLYFDVAFDPAIPSNLRARKPGDGVFLDLTPAERAAPACTHAALTAISIVHPRFPQWPIDLRRPGGLTCLDVFRGIYEVLHERVHVHGHGHGHVRAGAGVREKDAEGLGVRAGVREERESAWADGVEGVEGVDSAWLRACEAAWAVRCRDAPGLTEVERRLGMRRVDLLRGARMFAGLRRGREGRWELCLTHPVR